MLAHTAQKGGHDVRPQNRAVPPGPLGVSRRERPEICDQPPLLKTREQELVSSPEDMTRLCHQLHGSGARDAADRTHPRGPGPPALPRLSPAPRTRSRRPGESKAAGAGRSVPRRREHGQSRGARDHSCGRSAPTGPGTGLRGSRLQQGTWAWTSSTATPPKSKEGALFQSDFSKHKDAGT